MIYSFCPEDNTQFLSDQDFTRLLSDQYYTRHSSGQDCTRNLSGQDYTSLMSGQDYTKHHLVKITPDCFSLLFGCDLFLLLLASLLCFI